MDKLKPCPFCGGEIVATRYKHPSGTVAVYCGTCGAGIVRTDENALDDAHTAWNTRAERTCKVDRVEFIPKLGGMVVTWFDCGHVGYGNKTWFNYCPDCGARVVEE